MAISALNSTTTYSLSASLSELVILPRLKSGSSPLGKGFVVVPLVLFVIVAAGKMKVGVTLPLLPEITGLKPMLAVEEVAHAAPLLQTKAIFVELSLK